MGVYDPKKPSKFNSVNITLFLIVTVGGYFGYFYLPHWFGVWRMTGVMHGVANDAYRIFDEDKLLTKLVDGASRMGLQMGKENFKIERTPVPEEELANLAEAAANMTRNRGKKVILTMDYRVNAQWPLMDKITELHFYRKIEVDMTLITW